MKYQEAKDLAQRYAELVKQGCHRLEIVGSVKRADKAECHDIEFLVIADDRTPRPEFGQKVLHKTMLDKVLYDLCQGGALQPIKTGGEKFKQYGIVEAKTVNPFCLDIFIVRPETWGIQNVIRTGPSLFSHRFVTNQSMSFYDRETGRRFNGLLPDQYEYVRGETRILCGGVALSLPEETNALSVLGLGWIPPVERRTIALGRN